MQIPDFLSKNRWKVDKAAETLSMGKDQQQKQWKRCEQQAWSVPTTESTSTRYISDTETVLRSLLARSATLLTFKVVKQALRCVAELVTLSIEKHPAAQWRGAVGPRIFRCQGAVASIPLAGMSVTLFITIAIFCFFCTLGIQTSLGLWAESHGLFTVAALGVSRALTIIIRRLRMRVTASTILAWGTDTTRVCLAFLSHRQLRAIAPWTRRCVDALLPFLAFHLSASTVAAELTFCSRITLWGEKKKPNNKTTRITNFISTLRAWGKVSRASSFSPTTPLASLQEPWFSASSLTELGTYKAP